MAEMIATRRTIVEGAEFVLGETCSILNSVQAKYVIVGGWTPYLRNISKLTHPGTIDVDVLFEDGYITKSLHSVFEAFFDHGYFPSAKHRFQVLRRVQIASRILAYNVDLLHPAETTAHPQLFVDHFELGIREHPALGLVRSEVSIALPNSKIIFEGMFDELTVNHLNVQKEAQRIKFPLMDWTGLLISKAESVTSKKRQRDAFDIYLAFLQSDFDLATKLTSLAPNLTRDVRGVLTDLREVVSNYQKAFNGNVALFGTPLHENPAAFVANTIGQALK